MNRYTIQDQHHIYTRISKREAMRRVSEGDNQIVICPVKLRPGYPWAPHMRIQLDTDLDFDQLVTEFVWHNCNCNETGTYPAFYESKEITD